MVWRKGEQYNPVEGIVGQVLGHESYAPKGRYSKMELTRTVFEHLRRMKQVRLAHDAVDKLEEHLRVTVKAPAERRKEWHTLDWKQLFAASKDSPRKSMAAAVFLRLSHWVSGALLKLNRNGKIDFNAAKTHFILKEKPEHWKI